MDYKQAYKGITAIKKNKKDLLDTFFLPLVVDLGYQLSFDNGEVAGKTIVSHDENKILANLTSSTQIVFFGDHQPTINFIADKIYIYIDESYSLIVDIPRFSSMYRKFKIDFDDTKSDKNKFDQLIELITYRKDAQVDEKSMRSLQLDTDLSAFQNDEHELLQAVMQIINQALTNDDIGLIQFIIKKINSDYHTQYTNKEIMNILKADFKRRQNFKHQYMLVDVFEMAKQDENRQKQIQADIAQQKAAISEEQVKTAQTSTEQLDEPPRIAATDSTDKFKNIFYGQSENESKDDKNNSLNENNDLNKSNSESPLSNEDKANDSHEEHKEDNQQNIDYKGLFKTNSGSSDSDNDTNKSNNNANNEEQNLNNDSQKKEDDKNEGFYSKFF